MPIYEYRCTNCGHKLETIQRISDDPLTTCPNCQQEGLQKLISAASFRLKGSGWYETDFKTKKADKPAAKGGESKKADAKPTASKAKDTDKSKT